MPTRAVHWDNGSGTHYSPGRQGCISARRIGLLELESRWSVAGTAGESREVEVRELDGQGAER